MRGPQLPAERQALLLQRRRPPVLALLHHHKPQVAQREGEAALVPQLATEGHGLFMQRCRPPYSPCSYATTPQVAQHPGAAPPVPQLPAQRQAPRKQGCGPPVVPLPAARTPAPCSASARAFGAAPLRARQRPSSMPAPRGSGPHQPEAPERPRQPQPISAVPPPAPSPARRAGCRAPPPAVFDPAAFGPRPSAQLRLLGERQEVARLTVVHRTPRGARGRQSLLPVLRTDSNSPYRSSSTLARLGLPRHFSTNPLSRSSIFRRLYSSPEQTARRCRQGSSARETPKSG